MTLVKVRDTCLLPQIVTQAATALAHQAEGLTVRRQLPRQPLWLPWRLLCVKDQSVGHRQRGLVRIALYLRMFCATGDRQATKRLLYR